jgi:nucleoid DNA-binding protein
MALPKLTSTELVSELAESTGYTKSDVRHFLDALAELITDCVGQGTRVQVGGILVEPKLKKARKSRMGRNPATGESVKIPAKPASVVLKAKVVAPLSKAKLPSVKKLESLS